MQIPARALWGRARLGRSAVPLGALLAVYLGLQGVVALPAVRGWALGRAEEALRARVGEVSLGDVRFDPLFRVAAGPLALGGTAERPAIRVERLRIRAAPLALLAGRLEIASVRLHDVHVDAASPDALRELFGRRRGAGGTGSAGRRERAWPRVHVRGLRVLVAAGGAEREAGPWSLDVWPSDDEVRAELRLPGGGRVTLERRSVAEPGGLALAVRASGLRAEGLGQAGALLPVAFPAGTASLELDLEAPAGLARAAGRLRVAVEELSVAAARLGPAPVGPFQAAVSGEVAWDAVARLLTLREGRLEVGPALAAGVTGELRLEGETTFSVAVVARRVPFAAFAASLPPALAPPGEAPRPVGDLDARLTVEGPLGEPARWRLAATLDLTRLRAASRQAPPVALRGPFLHAPDGAPAFLVGPDNPDFVPVDELPEHVVRAVTTSEDAGFFAHAGFDFDELSIAMQEGLEAGHVVRGGSTITQQVAKNLWLSRDKVLARKVREALGAIALEAALPKARILEIYLNVAEWGPGVHGIGPGARHWFGKDARQLSPKEAAVLATVIPNPVRFDPMRASGALTEYFEQRVSELLLKLSTHGVLSDEALLAALEEPVTFRAEAMTGPLSLPSASPAPGPSAPAGESDSQ